MARRIARALIVAAALAGAVLLGPRAIDDGVSPPSVASPASLTPAPALSPEPSPALSPAPAPAPAPSPSSRAPAPPAPARPAARSIRGRLLLPPHLDGRHERLELSVVRRTPHGTEATVVRGAIRADGAYELPCPGAGEIAIQVVDGGEGVSETRRIHATAEGDVEGGDFTFESPDECLRGRVIAEAGGAPVYAADVRVPGEPAVRTDVTGRFTFGDPPSGSFELCVAHPDFAPAFVRLDRSALEREVVVAVRPGATLAVRVVDPSGAPQRSVVIALSSRLDARGHATDVSGCWEFRGLAPDEEYTIEAPGRRIEGGPPRLAIPAGERREVVVVLTGP